MDGAEAWTCAGAAKGHRQAKAKSKPRKDTQRESEENGRQTLLCAATHVVKAAPPNPRCIFSRRTRTGPAVRVDSLVDYRGCLNHGTEPQILS
jgi:hypothetical protein